MKTLLLLRHGKSDWDADYAGDHQRPLSKRGIRSARLIGRLVAGVDLVPDRVISSTALRAASTAELASASGGWGAPIDLEDGFYGTGPDTVLGLVSRAAGDRLLIVGHQPTWSMVGRRLTGAVAEMKTASLASIELMIDSWSDLQEAHGSLSLLIHPRQFFGSQWDDGG